MNHQEVGYVVQNRAGREDLLAELRERFTLQADASEAVDLTYFDTFDWRLHRRGELLALARSRRGKRLVWMSTAGDVLRSLAVDGAPAFAADLPPGAFRDALEEVIDVRRLLPAVEMRREQTLRVLDREEKTVARIALDYRRSGARDGTARREELPELLRVLPVRGYDKSQERVVRFLGSRNGLIRTVPGDPLAGVAPERGRGGLDIELEHGLRADEAAKRVYLCLLRTIRANEAGVLNDLDIEFLHDFRVAVRRTRTGLARLKGVLPHDAIAGFRREFAWLGAVTGPKRDLDVYLENMPGYRASVPEDVRRDLGPLEKYLKRRQKRELKRVVQALKSQRYKELVRDWERFLNQTAVGSDVTGDGARRIEDVARQRIRSLYRKVTRRGRAIDDATPEQALHDLRLDCKKLRYMLEFFRSLYDAGKIGRLIKGLKQLQDNLGTFNDLCVQRGALRQMAEDMTREGLAGVETVMAMGRLIEGLEERQALERRRFASRFERFDRNAQRALAKSLFSKGQA